MHDMRSLGSRPPPFRARLNYAHAYAANISSNVFRMRIIGASVSEPPLVDSTDALSR